MKKVLEQISSSKLSIFFIHVFAPILVGTLIYLFYRPVSIFVFHWISNFPYLESSIFFIRTKLIFTLPDIIIYSFPTGLWIYSFTSLTFIIWKESHKIFPIIWSAGFLLIALIFEIGQYLSVVPGVFDPIDAFITVIFYFISFYIFNNNKRIIYE